MNVTVIHFSARVTMIRLMLVQRPWLAWSIYWTLMGLIGRLAKCKLLLHANVGLVVFFGIFVDALLLGEHDFPDVE